MRPSVLLALLLVLSGCASRPTLPSQTWAGLRTHGLVLELVDPVRYERLSFSDAGMVMATVGERNGYLAGVGFSWRVRGEWLELGGVDEKFAERYRAIRVERRQVTTEDSAGRRYVFRYKHDA